MVLRNELGVLCSDPLELRNKEQHVKKPTYNLGTLMERARITTARELADRCGVNRKAVHNRARRGLSWSEADDFAIRCGFLPWEVWPEWADVNPMSWVPSHDLEAVATSLIVDQIEPLPSIPTDIAA